jgi:hypothetical protein
MGTSLSEPLIEYTVFSNLMQDVKLDSHTPAAEGVAGGAEAVGGIRLRSHRTVFSVQFSIR